MKQIWFIRHGQSESNAGLRMNSFHTFGLTEQGRTHAELVAEHFTNAPDLIVASPFERARQTALPLRRRFPDVPYEEWAVQEFVYLAAAHFQDVTSADLAAVSNAYWERNDPDHIDGEGAESFATFIQRGVMLREQLAQTPHNFVAIVSHGLFIKAFLWYTLQGSPRLTPKVMARGAMTMRGLHIGNGSIVKTWLGDNGDWYLGRIDEASVVHTTWGE